MQQESNYEGLTAMIEWPRPLSPQALKVLRAVLLGGLTLIALVQIIPFQLIGGLANHLFTVLLILSWVGPARRFFRRRTEERGSAQEES